MNDTWLGPVLVAGGVLTPDQLVQLAETATTLWAAVVGAVLYPPVMGFMSVNVGLAVAMLGAGVLSLASTLALLAARRLH